MYMHDPEMLAAAAQQEFGVDLNDANAVRAKLVELNTETMKGKYDKSNRLNEMYEQFGKLTAGEEKKAA